MSTKTIVDNDGKPIKQLSKKMNDKRNAAFNAIAKKAILVNMTRKQMANIPFDVTLANKLCKDYKIKDKSYIQVRKCILNPQHLINIRALISDALLMVFNNTRPWDNVGFRILPMSHYDDFIKTYGKLKDDFEEAVQMFKDNYNDYVKEAKKDLGKAFNKNDYPTKEQLDDLFSLDIQTSKFPNIDDIRLNLTNDELVDMQDEIVGDYTSVIDKSINELFKLIDEGKNKDEVVKMFNLIKTLNITNSSEINLKVSSIEESIKTKFGIETIEDSKKVTKDDMMVIADFDDDDLNDLEEFNLSGGN